MEKRSARRHTVGFKAELLCDGKCYAGFVENVSEKGLYMKAYPLNHGIDFTSGAGFELKFQIKSGEVIDLFCKVIWSNKTLHYNVTCCIGTEIMESSLKYREFLKSLD